MGMVGPRALPLCLLSCAVGHGTDGSPTEGRGGSWQARSRRGLGTDSYLRRERRLAFSVRASVSHCLSAMLLHLQLGSHRYLACPASHLWSEIGNSRS